MQIPIFFQGLIIGFSVAMPIGPIGILCIRRTLLQGRLSGFTTGLGVATADAIYGYVAIFGLSFISNFFITKQIFLRIIGGIFLFLLGLKILLKKNNHLELPAKIKTTNLITSYTSALFLTLTNPITVILFASIFSWWKIPIDDITSTASYLLISGIFFGSTLWFTFLSLIVGLLSYKFTITHLNWINKISGFTIIGFAILTFLSFIIT